MTALESVTIIFWTPCTCVFIHVRDYTGCPRSSRTLEEEIEEDGKWKSIGS